MERKVKSFEKSKILFNEQINTMQNKIKELEINKFNLEIKIKNYFENNNYTI